MPAEAGIQKSKNSSGFPFPDFSRTSFTGMTNMGNNSLAVSRTTDSFVMPHRRDLAAIFFWVYRENLWLLPKLMGPCIEEVNTVELDTRMVWNPRFGNVHSLEKFRVTLKREVP